MAKTFNPNRVGGGTVSIVRAADGTYSLKETGFDQISSLNMIDLGAVATTTTAAKTETAAEKTGTTVEDQTKAAFLLPKDDRDDANTFITESMYKDATDVSKSLQKTFERPNMRDIAGERTGTFDADTFDDAVGTRVKDPTEAVFGRSIPSKEQFERQDMLPEPKVEMPQEKLAVTSANVQKGLVDAPGFENPFKNMLGSKFQTEKGTSVNVDKGRGSELGEKYRSEVAQGGMPTDVERRQQLQLGSLGISADPSKTLAAKEADFASGSFPGRTVADADLEADAGAIPRAGIQPVAKKTFAQSVSTAFKGVGDFVMSGGVSGAVLRGIFGREETVVDVLNKNTFKTRGDLGSSTDPGRIVGNPAEQLYAGFNRVPGGNLERAGEKRLATRNKTLARRGVKDKAYANANGLKYDPKGVSANFHRNTKNMEKQQDNYRKDKNEVLVKEAVKKGASTMNPAEMRAATGGGGGSSGSKSKIVCTMMNESYGFGSFRNKIWMKFHKDLSPEYQKGYHRLFLPLVRIAKTNKIIKNILEHIAVHSTIDMRQSIRGKKHLLGRVYRKILLPICYWAGKK